MPHTGLQPKQLESIDRNTLNTEKFMLPDRVILSPDTLFQEIAGEGVILDLSSANYYGLDEVGVRFWQLLQDDSNVRNACARLASEFDVTMDRLESDLSLLLEQLANAGLVTFA